MARLGFRILVPEEQVVCVESRDPAFAACCWYLHRLDPDEDALAVSKNRKVVFLADGQGMVRVSGDDTDGIISYRVEASAPLATDHRPEPFRRLRLTGLRATIHRFVEAAVDEHRRFASTGEDSADGDERVEYWTWTDDMWCKSRLKRARPLDTLFLGQGAADLVADFRAFTSPASLERYRALHVAPTRIYMLHGLPGSGKTSLVHCVASETRHVVAAMTCGHDTTDSDLRAAMRSMPSRCVLCIEDIDGLFKEGRRSMAGGLTFAGLLGALDNCGEEGRGTAVFLTTNRMCDLDAALRRRIDYVLEFSHATADQARRMFAQFFPESPAFEEFWECVRHRRFSMSVLQKYLLKSLQNGGDPLRDVHGFDALATCADGDDSSAHLYM